MQDELFDSLRVRGVRCMVKGAGLLAEGGVRTEKFSSEREA